MMDWQEGAEGRGKAGLWAGLPCSHTAMQVEEETPEDWAAVAGGPHPSCLPDPIPSPGPLRLGVCRFHGPAAMQGSHVSQPRPAWPAAARCFQLPTRTMHAHTFTHMCTQCTYVHTHSLTCTHTHILSHTITFTRKNTRVHILIHARTRTRLPILTRAHASTHTHIHMHTHTHAHTHCQGTCAGAAPQQNLSSRALQSELRFCISPAAHPPVQLPGCSMASAGSPQGQSRAPILPSENLTGRNFKISLNEQGLCRCEKTHDAFESYGAVRSLSHLRLGLPKAWIVPGPWLSPQEPFSDLILSCSLFDSHLFCIFSPLPFFPSPLPHPFHPKLHRTASNPNTLHTW